MSVLRASPFWPCPSQSQSHKVWWREAAWPVLSGGCDPVTDARCALLTAALGFVQLRDQAPELVPLRRWLDSWRGMGDIVRGLTAQGLDLELQFPRAGG
jgi:hypothetical protein